MRRCRIVVPSCTSEALNSSDISGGLLWDHNAYYHRLLLSAVPRGAFRVLEVGCGAGQLAAKLAVRAEHVDAIDLDADMITAARAAVPANVACWQADVMDTPLTPNSYDAIVSMSALHHLPLTAALSWLARAARPGGILAAVALPRRDLPHELPIELAATTWHHVRPPQRDASPRAGADPRQVRDQARSVLPDVRVRRLVLWRYLLVWRNVAAVDSAAR